MKTKMTFTEILESEYRHIIEALEWGCSDPQIIEALKKELKDKTGYNYREMSMVTGRWNPKIRINNNFKSILK